MRKALGARMALLGGAGGRRRRALGGALLALALPAIGVSPASAAISLSGPGSVAEGPQSVIRYSVHRDGGFLQPDVTATVSLTGTATCGSDYEGPCTRTVLLPGSFTGTTQTFDVAVVDDSLYEGTESVVARISDGGGETVTGDGVTTAITDNDPLPVVAIGDAAAAEGTPPGAGGVLHVPVTLTGSTAVPATVAWSVSPGTASASDYSGPASGTLTLPAVTGQVTRTIDIPITPDNVGESDETVSVALGTVRNASLGASSATGTILDDDPVTVSVGSAQVKEGNAGTTTLAFPVTLSNPADHPVTVSYATSVPTEGSVATPGEDYTPVSGTLTFDPGQTSATVPVLVHGDTTPEADEFLWMNLSDPVGAGLHFSSALGTILDDDTPPPAPAVAPGSSTVSGAGTVAGTGAPFTIGVGTAGRSLDDATAPSVHLTPLRFRGPATVTTVLACPATEVTCRGTVTLFTRPQHRSKNRALRRELKIAKTRFVIPGGRKATITLTLGRGAAALVRRARRVPVRAFAVVDDGKGNIGTTQASGTLRR